jgi:uncharacterized protein (TIGR02266 family)
LRTDTFRSMVEERRSVRRARVSGVRVAYESAAGEQAKAAALDLGRGGLFVQTESPLPVGKRMALEIQVLGEEQSTEPWAALGRVVWARQTAEGELRPAGMGVRLIDADDSVLTAIDRLVEMRERTEPGLGEPDETIAVEPAAPPTAAPAREETLLGVGVVPASASPPEPSVPLDLVGKKTASAHAPAPTRATSGAHVGTRGRGRGGRVVAVVVLVAAAGVAAYVLLDGAIRDPAAVRSVPSASPPVKTSPSATFTGDTPTTTEESHEVHGVPSGPPALAPSAIPQAAPERLARPSSAPATTIGPPPRMQRLQPRRTDNPY